MSVQAFTRVCDLGILPELVTRTAGPVVLHRIFQDQDVPLELLSHPQAPLLQRDCLRLYQQAADVTGTRAFGLRVGARVAIRSLGVQWRYAASAPSLEHALSRCLETIRLHQNFSCIDVTHEGGDIRFAYDGGDRSRIGWRQYADMIVCLMVEFVRCYAGREWLPARIEVNYRRDAWGHDLEDHFDVPVLFDQPAIAIVFSKDLLDASKPQQIAATGVVTRSDLVLQYNSLPADFAGVCLAIVRQRLMSGQTDIRGAAEKFGLGERTFQRRLRQKGLSYSRLLASCQKERAIHLLGDDNISLTELAIDLGYASQPQLSRAFKQWTGVSPGTYRRTILAADRGSAGRRGSPCGAVRPAIAAAPVTSI